MFTIVLKSATNERLVAISQPGNDAYLIRDEATFPMLGDLDDCSYDVFASEDMPDLIAELRRVRDELRTPDDVAHVDDIIALAERCAREPGTRLVFTPFQRMPPALQRA